MRRCDVRDLDLLRYFNMTRFQMPGSFNMTGCLNVLRGFYMPGNLYRLADSHLIRLRCLHGNGPLHLCWLLDLNGPLNLCWLLDLNRPLNLRGLRLRRRLTCKSCRSRRLTCKSCGFR